MQNNLLKFRFLPLFYTIPKELLDKTPLRDFPRNLHTVASSPQWEQVYHSGMFQLVLCDTWAYLTFPHFGIKGFLESYSGYDPFWKLAHCYPYWEQALNSLGYSVQSFLKVPPDHEIPFPDYAYADKIAQTLVQIVWEEYQMDDIREVIEEHRAFEDYDDRYSYEKAGFQRKYYHTRTRWKHYSMDTDDIELSVSTDSTPNTDVRLSLQRFIQTLAKKDQQIMNLLYQGHTQKQIADKLGYQNHSGVCKRIAYIRNQLEQFDSTLKPKIIQETERSVAA